MSFEKHLPTRREALQPSSSWKGRSRKRSSPLRGRNQSKIKRPLGILPSLQGLFPFWRVRGRDLKRPGYPGLCKSWRPLFSWNGLRGMLCPGFHMVQRLARYEGHRQPAVSLPRKKEGWFALPVPRLLADCEMCPTSRKPLSCLEGWVFPGTFHCVRGNFPSLLVVCGANLRADVKVVVSFPVEREAVKMRCARAWVCVCVICLCVCCSGIKVDVSAIAITFHNSLLQ